MPTREQVEAFNEGKDPGTNPTAGLKDALLYVLSKVKGVIPREDLVTWVNRAAATRYPEREIRDGMTELRRQGAMIVGKGGTGGGYFRAKSWEELEDYTEGVLNATAMSQLRTRSEMRTEGRRVFGPKQERML